MNAEQLFNQFERVFDMPNAISKLRKFILNMAVRGKLVEQDLGDEPAEELLIRILDEKTKLIDLGTIKQHGISPIILTGTPFAIPKSWQWVALESVFLYDAGIKRKPETLDPNIWLLHLEDIEKNSGCLLSRVRVFERTPASVKSEFQANDILYGKLRPYLNKVLVADQHGYSTTEIVALRPYLPLCSEYCSLALRRPDFVAYVTKLGQGTKMPRLRTEDAKVAAFPLPPLSEQYRIAAKVDELLVNCDQWEEKFNERESLRKKFTLMSLASVNEQNLKPMEFNKRAKFVRNNFDRLTKQVGQIEKFRKAILKLGVRGKLVKQDSNEESAKELLDRIKREKDKLIETGVVRKQTFSQDYLTEAPFKIPMTWEWVRLWQIGAIVGGGTPRTIYTDNFANPGTGIAWITPADLGKQSSLYVSRGSRDLSEKGLSKSSARLVPSGSVLFSCRAPIGYVAIAENSVSTNQGIKSLIPYISESSKYIALVLTCIAPDIEAGAPGTTYREISGKLFAKILFPLPPLSEQNRIIATVDELMTCCKKLENSLVTRQNTNSSLLNSMLHELLSPVREDLD